MQHSNFSPKHHCCDCKRGAGNGRHLHRVAAILSPSHRLFCSAVLLQQNVLTEPLKNPVLNWADTHMRMTAKGILISTDYTLFHRGIPRSFSMLSMTFLKTSWNCVIYSKTCVFSSSEISQIRIIVLPFCH